MLRAQLDARETRKKRTYVYLLDIVRTLFPPSQPGLSQNSVVASTIPLPAHPFADIEVSKKEQQETVFARII